MPPQYGVGRGHVGNAEMVDTRARVLPAHARAREGYPSTRRSEWRLLPVP